MYKCNDCGGWDESEFTWSGKEGYACECIRCEICGEVIGNSSDGILEEHPHNTEGKIW